MKSLVKIHASMKPKDAARIFERLELAVPLDVVERMREARTAPILAKMSAVMAEARPPRKQQKTDWFRVLLNARLTTRR